MKLTFEIKEQILVALRAKIAEELSVLTIAAETAINAATHEESKAEDQHDTRSTEASYLAAGQLQRVKDLKFILHSLGQYQLKNFSADDAIDVGSVIELEANHKSLFYFLLPVAGGYKIELQGLMIQVITAQSLMGEELLDKAVGDDIIILSAGKEKKYKVKNLV